MGTVLGIVASPRRLGNCEIVVKEMGRHLPDDWEMQLLRLQDFVIQPCTGCYRCLYGEEICVIKDDLAQLMTAVCDADALVVASPTYFLGANAGLKAILDRGLSFYTHLDRLWGKPAVGIGIAGIAHKQGRTLLDIESFLKLLMTDIKAAVMLFGALPGEVFQDSANQRQIKRLAGALLGELLPKPGFCCPLCGGDTFRFLDKETVQCMLCSNLGELRIENGQKVLTIERSTHELFLTKSDARDHHRWLREMRQRFLKHRKDLKQITLQYRKGPKWIRPSTDPGDTRKLPDK